MHFQHTTPMPSGISVLQATAEIGVPQMLTAEGNSGTTHTIIPGDVADTLSVNLLQLLITWGGVTTPGKFVIASEDTDSITIFQDKAAGTIVLPCYNLERHLGTHGLTIQDTGGGGEYAIVANFLVKEL